MRIALTTLTVSAAILTALLIGSSDVCHAQDQSEFNIESASVVEVSAMPTNGIFWSMSSKFPPSPFDPMPSLSLYTDGTPGNFWFDDRDFDYQSYWAQMSAEANASSGGGRTMDDVPPPPGDGGDGTNLSGGGVSSSGASFSTNGLWLEITGITNGIISLNLNNPTNQVYAIWSRTDLLTGWNVETEVWPTNTGVMPFTVPTLDRQNLFMEGEDWTGVTANGNTTPLWWFWWFFGSLDLSDTNLDTSGVQLVTNYQNNWDFNIISFCTARRTDTSTRAARQSRLPFRPAGPLQCCAGGQHELLRRQLDALQFESRH